MNIKIHFIFFMSSVNRCDVISDTMSNDDEDTIDIIVKTVYDEVIEHSSIDFDVSVAHCLKLKTFYLVIVLFKSFVFMNIAKKTQLRHKNNHYMSIQIMYTNPINFRDG